MSRPVTAPQNTIFEAAAGDVVYFLCQSGDKLTEEIFDGEMGAPLEVGLAKSGTAGAYALLGDKRVIICLGQGDVLKDFHFDDEEWEWKEGELATLGITASSSAEIAVTSGNEYDVTAVFQTPAGEMNALYLKDGESWQHLELPPTRPLTNAGVFGTHIQGVPHFFYAHQDLSIHLLVFDKGKWSDTNVPLTDGGDTPKCYILAAADENGYSLQFCDSKKNAYLLSEGSLTMIGKFTPGGFHFARDAQNTKGRLRKIKTKGHWK